MLKPIGQYLVEAHLVTEEELKKALDLQARRLQGGDAQPIGEILEEMQAVDENDIHRELEQQAQDRIRLFGEDSRG